MVSTVQTRPKATPCRLCAGLCTSDATASVEKGEEQAVEERDIGDVADKTLELLA